MYNCALQWHIWYVVGKAEEQRPKNAFEMEQFFPQYLG
jgi:hypothetical protein